MTFKDGVYTTKDNKTIKLRFDQATKSILMDSYDGDQKIESIDGVSLDEAPKQMVEAIKKAI